MKLIDVFKAMSQILNFKFETRSCSICQIISNLHRVHLWAMNYAKEEVEKGKR